MKSSAPGSTRCAVPVRDAGAWCEKSTYYPVQMIRAAILRLSLAQPGDRDELGVDRLDIEIDAAPA